MIKKLNAKIPKWCVVMKRCKDRSRPVPTTNAIAL
jgi:ribosomal protein L39E